MNKLSNKDYSNQKLFCWGRKFNSRARQPQHGEN